jgi:hypothetical protein
VLWNLAPFIYLPHAGLLLGLFFDPLRWKRHVLPKRLSTNGLHAIDRNLKTNFFKQSKYIIRPTEKNLLYPDGSDIRMWLRVSGSSE